MSAREWMPGLPGGPLRRARQRGAGVARIRRDGDRRRSLMLTPEMRAQLREAATATDDVDGWTQHYYYDDRDEGMAYLVATGSARQFRVALGMTEWNAAYIAAAQPSVVLALLDAADERDRLAAAIERGRALHQRGTVEMIAATDCMSEDCDHDGDCPTRPVEVCLGCVDLVETATIYALEEGEIQERVAWPCPTIRALDGSDG